MSEYVGKRVEIVKYDESVPGEAAAFVGCAGIVQMDHADENLFPLEIEIGIEGATVLWAFNYDEVRVLDL